MERHDTTAWPDEEKYRIFTWENMAFLSENQNLRFTRRRKYHARLYMIYMCGAEAIQEFLNSIYCLDWAGLPRYTVEQLLAQVSE